jgi:hypothetical protein
MTSPVGTPKLSTEEVARKRAEHHEYVRRFNARFGHVKTESLGRRIAREGFDESPFFRRLQKRLALSAVIDAKFVLDMLRGEVLGKPSSFWELVQSGVVTCWAPTGLERDLNGKFQMLAEKLGRPVDSIRIAWEQKIAKHIHIAASHEHPEVTAALARLTKRDPHDVDYPGLVLLLGADACLTMDKDIIEDGGVTTRSLGDVIRIVHTHDRGRVAMSLHFQTAEVLSIVLGVGGEALKEGWLGLKALAKAIPEKVLVGLGLGIGAFLFFDTTREWLLKRIAPFRAGFGVHWDRFKQAAQEAWKFLHPIIDDVMRANEEAEALVDAMPKRPRKIHRIARSVRECVVTCLKNARRGMAVDEVVRTMFPRLYFCEIEMLRRQIYGILRSHPEIRRVKRGIYRYVHRFRLPSS